jgi:protein-S-isoprenylcysteine O-methyltransferase Ste14
VKLILLKTIIFTIVVPCTVTILLPYYFLSSRKSLLPAQIGSFQNGGALAILFGTAIYFRCAWDFTFAGRGTPAPVDPPKELVVRGLYRYVRNPMYVGVLSILFGEALLFESRVLFQYAAGVFLIFFLVVVVYEEPVLRHKFGESYRQYCESVPRWIPWKIHNKRKP